MMKLYWKFRNHFMSEDGIGVVEMILILVILIALVLVFKDKVKGIVEQALSKIGTDSTTIIGK